MLDLIGWRTKSPPSSKHNNRAFALCHDLANYFDAFGQIVENLPDFGVRYCSQQSSGGLRVKQQSGCWIVAQVYRVRRQIRRKEAGSHTLGGKPFSAWVEWHLVEVNFCRQPCAFGKARGVPPQVQTL